jgi:hypothetical protein
MRERCPCHDFSMYRHGRRRGVEALVVASSVVGPCTAAIAGCPTGGFVDDRAGCRPTMSDELTVTGSFSPRRAAATRLLELWPRRRSVGELPIHYMADSNQPTRRIDPCEASDSG